MEMKFIFCSQPSSSHFVSEKCSNTDFCASAKIQHMQLKRALFCRCFTQEFLSVIVNALQNRSVGFLVLVPHHQVADDISLKKTPNFPTYTNLCILEVTIGFSVETQAPSLLPSTSKNLNTNTHTQTVYSRIDVYTSLRVEIDVL